MTAKNAAPFSMMNATAATMLEAANRLFIANPSAGAFIAMQAAMNWYQADRKVPDPATIELHRAHAIRMLRTVCDDRGMAPHEICELFAPAGLR